MSQHRRLILNAVAVGSLVAGMLVMPAGPVSAGSEPPASAFPHECSEAGLDEAIAAGSGGHRFTCSEDTVIVIEETKIITGNVTLYGEDLLQLSGSQAGRIWQSLPW